MPTDFAQAPKHPRQRRPGVPIVPTTGRSPSPEPPVVIIQRRPSPEPVSGQIIVRTHSRASSLERADPSTPIIIHYQPGKHEYVMPSNIVVARPEQNDSLDSPHRSRKRADIIAEVINTKLL